MIHAGIYYPTGSVKAETCVRGKALLYDYCRSHAVPHMRGIGKIIVATRESHFETLRGYRAQARGERAWGELPWLDADEVSELEPAVRSLGGIYSESTGIVDSHALMLSLQGDLEARGGVVSLCTEVTGLRAATATASASPAATTNCRRTRPSTPPDSPRRPSPGRSVPGTGAFSPRATTTRSRGRARLRTWSIRWRSPAGSACNVTLDLAGQARFGPDVVWIDDADYDFDAAGRDRFVAAIRRYYPGLDEERLHPGYTGIRPKVVPAGAPAGDFVIEGPAQHGIAGLINLLGIESPGMTAALAIAERVGTLAGS